MKAVISQLLPLGFDPPINLGGIDVNVGQPEAGSLGNGIAAQLDAGKMLHLTVADVLLEAPGLEAILVLLRPVFVPQCQVKGTSVMADIPGDTTTYDAEKPYCVCMR